MMIFKNFIYSFLLLAFYSPLLSKMENDFEVDAILRIQKNEEQKK